MEETKKTVEPANADKGAKKARQTLVKWGFEGADVDLALGATEAATADALVEGQTEFNKKRQVAALDWLLLNAPEDSIPVEYRNDAIRRGRECAPCRRSSREDCVKRRESRRKRQRETRISTLT